MFELLEEVATPLWTTHQDAAGEIRSVGLAGLPEDTPRPISAEDIASHCGVVDGHAMGHFQWRGTKTAKGDLRVSYTFSFGRPIDVIG